MMHKKYCRSKGRKYTMLTRQNALHTWLNSLTNDQPFSLTPLAGDASFRRYFRLQHGTSSHVVMDAPPAKEGLLAFIQVARALRTSGVQTPEVFAFDLNLGFALLEDFGDTLLYNTRLSEDAEQHYLNALNTLHHIQPCNTEIPMLAPFNLRFMEDELQLFRTWFLERWLGITLTDLEENMLNHTLSCITEDIMQQPQCLVHSDYHSKNLVVTATDPHNKAGIGVLDFQDALLGPFTYDLVSLLKDAYVAWPKATQTRWIDSFYQNLPNKHGWSRDEFDYGFLTCGLQRHLKILGIFCRLDQRDGKSAYLRDLPLTLQYVLEALEQHEPFHACYDFMQTRVVPVFEEKMNA
jgi:N-acetylmuramate 1-kinase